jgi:hypothetical protein
MRWLHALRRACAANRPEARPGGCFCPVCNTPYWRNETICAVCWLAAHPSEARKILDIPFPDHRRIPSPCEIVLNDLLYWISRR